MNESFHPFPFMIPPEMSVVPLTLTISLSLVATFVVFFIREQKKRGFSGLDEESLLPLAVEKSRIVQRESESSEDPMHS